jgi:hypothetical protein
LTFSAIWVEIGRVQLWAVAPKANWMDEIMRVQAIVVLLTVFPALASARGGEKVDVEPAGIGPAEADVTVVVAPDHRFAVGGTSLGTSGLAAYITEWRKDHSVRYVLVSGEAATIGDLVAVAHIAQRMHFTVLFESGGEMKTLTLVK